MLRLRRKTLKTGTGHAKFDRDKFYVAESRFIGPSPWSQVAPSSLSLEPRATEERGRGQERQHRGPISLITASLKSLLDIRRLLLLALCLVLSQCAASNRKLRCAVALSPLFSPAQRFCNLDDTVFSPLCHSIQRVPSGEDWCNQPFNPLELLVQAFKNEPHTQSRPRRNFASEGGGAFIIREFTSVTHGRVPCTGSSESEILACNLNRNGNINSPAVTLEENLGDGECWEFAGGTGQLSINLAEPVVISHVSIDHPSPDILSARARLRMPKDMSLWVLVVGDAEVSGGAVKSPAYNISHLTVLPFSEFRMRPSPNIKVAHQQSPPPPKTGSFVRIADFQYDISTKSTTTRQTFTVNRDWRIKSEVAALRIESNFGGETTCFYWLGIHGSA